MAGHNRVLLAVGLIVLPSAGGAAAQTTGIEALALASVVDADVDVRSRAIAQLSVQRGDAVAIEALSAAAVLDLVPEVRAEAVIGLGQIGDKRSMSVFGHAVLDPDPRVRRAAVTAVGDLGGDPMDVLATGLLDVDAHVREAAVYALGRAKPEAVVMLLESVVADPHPAVREAAALVLSELHGAPSRP